MKLIDKDAVVAEIERRKHKLLDNIMFEHDKEWVVRTARQLNRIIMFLDTLEVKEVDLDFEQELYKAFGQVQDFTLGMRIAKYFFELGIKAQHDNWKVVDNTNLPQGDRTKIYCVFTKDRYILATVINHPKDEELLQWRCTEFPFHRYDMCEGDKYMQIV